MAETMKSTYAGKCESNLVHQETITWAIGDEIYLSKDDTSGMWIKCTNKDCFLKQGGKMFDASKKFTSSKFPLADAPKIATLASEISETFIKKITTEGLTNDKIFEERIVAFLSCYKTISSAYKP